MNESCLSNEQQSYYFKNIKGEPITLIIQKCNNSAIKFKVAKVPKNSLRKETLKLFILCVLNLVIGFLQLSATTIIGIVVSFWCIISLLNQTQSESLLVIPGFGLQIKTKFRFRQSTVFISWESFKDVIINEIISKHTVIDYLIITTKDKNNKPNKKVIPVFCDTKPHLDCLKLIYIQIYTLINR